MATVMDLPDKDARKALAFMGFVAETLVSDVRKRLK
jgi:hypothetical protein